MIILIIYIANFIHISLRPLRFEKITHLQSLLTVLLKKEMIYEMLQYLQASQISFVSIML